MNDLINREETEAALTQLYQKLLAAAEAGDESPEFLGTVACGVSQSLDAIRALPAASQPEAEPVAWQQRLDSGGWGTILHGNDKPLGEARPLYATPAPVVPAEGLKRAPVDEAKAGWVLDMELLKELRSDAGDWGCSLDLEAVEAIALEVEKRLRAQQPAAPVSGVTVREAGWRPIETAPRDGTIIVAISGVAGHNGYSIIFWDEDGWAGYTAEDEKRLVRFPPALWCDIPEPPAALLPAGEGE